MKNIKFVVICVLTSFALVGFGALVTFDMGGGNTFTLNESGDGSNMSNTPTAMSVITNGISRSIVTTDAAANGWQISSSRASFVTYSTTTTTTSSITGSQSGYIVMEECPSNSTTAASWIEVNRTGGGNSFTLAVAVQDVAPSIGSMANYIPAGWFVRMRSVSVSGTPTFAYNSGQEITF